MRATTLTPMAISGSTRVKAASLGERRGSFGIGWMGTMIFPRLKQNRCHKCMLHLRAVSEKGNCGLAAESKYQFPWWAPGLGNARPVEEKKGADGGADGKILLRDHPAPKQKPHSIIFSLKGGGAGVRDVRALDSVVTKNGASIGVLISIGEPTRPMRGWAANTGSYRSGFNGQKYPRIQLRTIGQLMAAVTIERPSGNVPVDATSRKVPKARGKEDDQLGLLQVGVALLAPPGELDRLGFAGESAFTGLPA